MLQRQNKRVLHISLKAVFAFLSILLVPIYTIAFGTKESPLEYTLSNIGNFFGHKLSFILWGVITGACLVFYFFYTFHYMDYEDKRARKYLILSDIFLFLTVITPALKDVLPFLHFLHVVYSALFALFLVATILLFIQYLAITDKRISKFVYWFFLGAIAIPVITLFMTGLNGIVEILFFVMISLFLFVLNIALRFVDKRTKGSMPAPEAKSTGNQAMQ